MYNIALIKGDGIGPELSEAAISVLETINDKLDLKFEINQLDALIN
jgi:3-isopropylmalate dehydrogenase